MAGTLYRLALECALQECSTREIINKVTQKYFELATTPLLQEEYTKEFESIAAMLNNLEKVNLGKPAVKLTKRAQHHMDIIEKYKGTKAEEYVILGKFLLDESSRTAAGCPKVLTIEQLTTMRERMRVIYSSNREACVDFGSAANALRGIIDIGV